MNYIVWKGNTNVVKGSSLYQSVRIKINNMCMEVVSIIKESVAKLCVSYSVGDIERDGLYHLSMTTIFQFGEEDNL